MTQEAQPVDLNHNPPTIQEVTETVVTTRRRVPIHRDGKPVAYLVPADQAVTQPAGRPAAHPEQRRRAKRYTLESAFGAVPTPPHLQGKSLDEISDMAKEDYTDRISRE